MDYHHTLGVGTELDGTYTILSVLGSGGFANTYKAHDRTLKREVAIKEYFPGDIAVRAGATTVRCKTEAREQHFRWGLERFEREAQTLSKFRHANIVRVFRVFKANDTAYMVLEFVDGADMESWLKSLKRPLTQAELDSFLDRMLNALEVIHKAEVLHRDVKPENIYIRASDSTPVLLDFGAARSAVSELTGTTNAIVSRGYSPHEAYSTDASLQGPWTDIYGLAATVYRAISGDAPPESASRVLDTTMVAARKLPGAEKAYRPSFLSAIDHALEVMPKKRPQSVAAWRSELQSGVTSKRPTQPVVAGATSQAQPTGPRTGGRAPTQPSAPRIGQRTDRRPGLASGTGTRGSARAMVAAGGALVLAGGVAVAALQMNGIADRAIKDATTPETILVTQPVKPPVRPDAPTPVALQKDAKLEQEDKDRAESEAQLLKIEQVRREEKVRRDEENARIDRAKREADELKARVDEEIEKRAQAAHEAAERQRLQQQQEALDKAHRDGAEAERLARIKKEADDREAKIEADREREKRAAAAAKRDEAKREAEQEKEEQQRTKERERRKAKSDDEDSKQSRPTRRVEKERADPPQQRPTAQGTPRIGGIY